MAPSVWTANDSRSYAGKPLASSTPNAAADVYIALQNDRGVSSWVDDT
ncbi:hypothetical protein KTQ42_18970 [Noviherbaspirillum sp. L7-7A]|nr:hypothetical protein [Noviherbaspirillum sp. L7-7A]MBV0881377.1 hypothetical protein [Noviherbaspirillum sp. L7-7A]